MSPSNNHQGQPRSSLSSTPPSGFPGTSSDASTLVNQLQSEDTLVLQVVQISAKVEVLERQLQLAEELRRQAEEEKQKAEEERKQAEEQRKQAEVERQQAEEERQRLEEERQQVETRTPKKKSKTPKLLISGNLESLGPEQQKVRAELQVRAPPFFPLQ